MQGYTRRQLKQDRFAETAMDAADWASVHRRLIIWGTVIAVIVAAALGGFFAWHSRQNERANVELSTAMRTFSEPLRPAGAPPVAAGEDPGFSTAADRAKAAAKQFQGVADRYSLTKPGRLARYMQGVASMQAGDNASAERLLKDVAGSRDKDVASLANMALATLYRSMGRQADAVKIYKELEGNPTDTVSKAEAQLAMAAMYEASDPQQAASIYQQIQKEAPSSAAAQIAASRLNSGTSPAIVPEE
ncbi:MAG TPA: tetratricopeptide repeat protein [Terriglobales bacterium]